MAKASSFQVDIRQFDPDYPLMLSKDFYEQILKPVHPIEPIMSHTKEEIKEQHKNLEETFGKMLKKSKTKDELRKELLPKKKVGMKGRTAVTPKKTVVMQPTGQKVGGVSVMKPTILGIPKTKKDRINDLEKIIAEYAKKKEKSRLMGKPIIKVMQAKPKVECPDCSREMSKELDAYYGRTSGPYLPVFSPALEQKSFVALVVTRDLENIDLKGELRVRLPTRAVNSPS